MELPACPEVRACHPKGNPYRKWSRSQADRSPAPGGGYCNSFFLQGKLVWIGIADENRNQKLYICDVEDGSPAEPEILYEEGGLNYGTYNKDCLFVFREDGESVECLKLTYEGELSRIAKVDDKRSVRLLFSAFEGYACFYDNGRIRIVDV